MTKDRRKQSRVPLKLPVRVQGRDADGTAWDEVASTSRSPFPKRFREHDISDQSYRVYVLVRSTFGSIPPARVGVVFFGKNPPRGASSSLPGELFLMSGDPNPEERRRAPPEPALPRRPRAGRAAAPGRSHPLNSALRAPIWKLLFRGRGASTE